MDNDKIRSIESIVEAACDRGRPEGPEPHQALFSEFRRIDTALRVPMFEPPHSLAALAKSLMEAPQKRNVLARLVFSTLQPVAVRSPRPNSFQLAFQSDEADVRMMYAPEGKHWDVVGQVTEPGWSVTRAGRNVAVDPEGRFAFRAKSLDQTDLILSKDDVEVAIPSAQEAAGNGLGNSG